MSRKSFDTETLIAIGDRIRRIRGSRNQQEFADLLGVSRSVISNYEAGRRLPNGETVNKIAEIGQKTPAWVLTGGDNKSTNEQFSVVEKYFKENLDKDEHSRSLKSLISDDELSLLMLIRELDHIQYRNMYVRVMNEFKDRHNSGREDMTYYAIPEYDKLLKSIKEDGLTIGKDPFRLMFSLINDAEARARHKGDPEGAQ